MDVLFQFFAGYFNQDWNAGGEDSWRGVVRHFVKTNSRARVIQVRDELGQWAASAEPGTDFPPEFGCEYHPRGEGLSDTRWAQEIVALIESQL